MHLTLAFYRITCEVNFLLCERIHQSIPSSLSLPSAVFDRQGESEMLRGCRKICRNAELQVQLWVKEGRKRRMEERMRECQDKEGDHLMF